MSETHRKLKIVHTEASLGWGGQEIRVMVELKEMARRGHQTFLIAPPGSDIFRRGLDAGIATFPLSMKRLDFYVNRKWLVNFFREKEIDVVNTHSSRDSWLAGSAAKKAGVPLVIKTRHISARVSRGILTRFVYQHLHDYIITTSTGIADTMVELNRFDPKRISAVPTGVDMNRYHDQIQSLGIRKELGLPQDCKLVGMVSVLRSWKGHPDFLRAAKMVRSKHPKTYFIIVGEGPRRGPIEDDLLDLGLENFVYLVGHRDEIPQILKDLDIFVLPSFANEGVPQAILQAMAMKRPIVASSVGGIPEVITPGSNGLLCEPQNPEDLAQCINQLLDKPDLARQMAEAGREVVKNRFSLDAMIQELESIYRKSLNGHQRS